MGNFEMKLIDGPIKKEIQEAIRMYDALPDWIKEKEYQKDKKLKERDP